MSQGDELFAAMSSATSVYNNASGSVTCFELPYDDTEQVFGSVWVEITFTV